MRGREGRHHRPRLRLHRHSPLHPRPGTPRPPLLAWSRSRHTLSPEIGQQDRHQPQVRGHVLRRSVGSRSATCRATESTPRRTYCCRERTEAWRERASSIGVDVPSSASCGRATGQGSRHWPADAARCLISRAAASRPRPYFEICRHGRGREQVTYDHCGRNAHSQ